MIKINVLEVLVDVRTKEPLRIDDHGLEVDMVFRHAAGEALGAIIECDKDLSQEEKLKRGRLIERIYDNEEVKLSTEEAALVKERIGKNYGPLVVVAVEKIFERDPEKEIK